MADAFVYMFVVGSGFSSGVAFVMFISWKIYSRSKNKTNKKRRAGK